MGNEVSSFAQATVGAVMYVGKTAGQMVGIIPPDPPPPQPEPTTTRKPRPKPTPAPPPKYTPGDALNKLTSECTSQQKCDKEKAAQKKLCMDKGKSENVSDETCEKELQGILANLCDTKNNQIACSYIPTTTTTTLAPTTSRTLETTEEPNASAGLLVGCLIIGFICVSGIISSVFFFVRRSKAKKKKAELEAGVESGGTSMSGTESGTSGTGTGTGTGSGTGTTSGGGGGKKKKKKKSKSGTTGTTGTSQSQAP